MIEQRVTNPPLRGLKGVALIALVVVAAALGSNFFYFLRPYIGNLSSILFIVYGVFIAWLLMDHYVLGYLYTCQNGCLRICRVYGKREWFVTDVWLNGIRATGPLEQMKGRFPGARVHRAIKSECPIEPVAVAYNDAGRTAIAVLQPDAELREKLLQAVKG